jgi:hypothetical protein
MWSQGMNLQFREPIGQFCSASLARSTAAAEKPGAVLTIASRGSLMVELLRRETGVPVFCLRVNVEAPLGNTWSVGAGAYEGRRAPLAFNGNCRILIESSG